MRLTHPLGRLIATRRRELGLTQDQVAQALGVPRSNVAAWENGDRNVPPDHLPALEPVLRVSGEVLVRHLTEAVPRAAIALPLAAAPLTPIECTVETMAADIAGARQISEAAREKVGEVQYGELEEMFLRQTASELMAGHVVLLDTADLQWTSPLLEGSCKYVAGEDKEYEGHLMRLSIIWEREKERVVFMPQVPFGVHAQDPRYRVDYLIVHSAPRLQPATVGLELDGDHGWKSKSDAERTDRLPFPVVRFDNAIVRSPNFLFRLLEQIREKARIARISRKTYRTYLTDRRREFENDRGTAA